MREERALLLPQPPRGEASGLPERRRGMDAWLAEIEMRWREIPELEIPEGALEHLAIICDGNRRAASERGLNPLYGHQAGIEVTRGIINACQKWKIRTATFWVWSTENWQRDNQQVNFVMELTGKQLRDPELVRDLKEKGVRVSHLGRKDRLPKEVREGIASLVEETSKNDAYRLNLALDYGGRDEAVRAIAKIASDAKEGKLEPEAITRDPSIIDHYFDTADQPPPDLVIRTGVKEEGEMPHTSGFMPLQTVHSSWHFLPELFPNLSPQDLKFAIEKFLASPRRFGR